MRILVARALRFISPETAASPHSEKPGLLSNVFTAKALFGWPPPPLDPARETAWLDGLRGVAAFLVMTYHFHLTLWFTGHLEAPYGAYATSDGKPVGQPLTELWRLPLIRLWMVSGHAQVSVFFALSGFVLSWSPLRAIGTGQLDRFAQNLGSATLRRWLRLFLPCFPVALWQCFEFYYGLRSLPKTKASNIFSLLVEFVVDQVRFADPFLINRTTWTSINAYDSTMWTIPYEWAGSLLVFLVLLAVCRIRSFTKRTIAMLVVNLFALIQAEWNFWLFSSGMLLSNYVRYMGGFANIAQQSWRSSVAWGSVMLASLLLAGVPEVSVFFSRPGYIWLLDMTPSTWMEAEGGGRFWWSWAGVLFITSASHLKSAQSFFSTNFMRYLGRISFMLYLTHRITLNLIGEPVKKVVYGLFGRKVWINLSTAADGAGDPFVTFVVYVVFMGIVVPLSMLVAHWCEVLIDGPSTRFAKSVDGWFAADTHDASILPTRARDVVVHEERIELLPQPGDVAEPGRDLESPQRPP